MARGGPWRKVSTRTMPAMVANGQTRRCRRECTMLPAPPGSRSLRREQTEDREEWKVNESTRGLEAGLQDTVVKRQQGLASERRMRMRECA